MFRRRALIFLLALGTVTGYASGFASLSRWHHSGPGGSCHPGQSYGYGYGYNPGPPAPAWAQPQAPQAPRPAEAPAAPQAPQAPAQAPTPEPR